MPPHPDGQVECSSGSPLTAEDISPVCCGASPESSTGPAFCWRMTPGTAAKNAQPAGPVSFDRAELLPQPGYSSMWCTPPDRETMKGEQRAYNTSDVLMKLCGWTWMCVNNNRGKNVLRMKCGLLQIVGYYLGYLMFRLTQSIMVGPTSCTVFSAPRRPSRRAKRSERTGK